MDLSDRDLPETDLPETDLPDTERNDAIAAEVAKGAPPPAPGPVDAMARLAAEYLKVNRQTRSAEGYREPGEIVEEALERWGDLPDPGDQPDTARRGFALVLATARALAEGDRQAAEALAQRALGLMQNNLHLQSLLARARGDEEAGFQGRFCRAPFENLETNPGGDVHFCCPAWLPKPIGNLNDASAEEIWNSAAARDIRASIHDGSYRYCSRQHCPKLANLSLEETGKIRTPKFRRIAEARRVRVDDGPAKVILAHDRSCNLACPTCRSSLILARKEEQKALNAMADSVILPLLRQAERVRVTASGDPFGSAHFQHVLRSLDETGNPDLKVDIQTNGLLLTPALWETLKLEGRVGHLIVSADAARAETYEIVRRPGKFATLSANLEFFATLRRDARVQHFRLDFVVQALNYREMPAFVAMARSFGCDGVKFQMVRSWGSFSPQEFETHNIGDRAHPEYPAFLRVLAEVAPEAPYASFWGMGQAMKDAGL